MPYYLPDCPVEREIRYIVVHCTGSRVTTDFTIEDLRHLHVDIFHWSDIGYNFYIRKDGSIYNCRPMSKIGAHTKGYNDCSIGVCYEGGLNARGSPTDTKIVGHYELGANKKCPVFCASKEYSTL